MADGENSVNPNPSVTVVRYGVFGALKEFESTQTSWKNYCNKLKYFFSANEITDPNKKRDIFLSVVGDQCLSILTSLLTPKEPDDCTYDALITILTDHFEPAPSETVCCFRFNARRQFDNESVTNYIIELRKLAQSCAFTDLEKQLKVQFISGLKDKNLQMKLLAQKNITITSAVEIAMAHEAAQQNVKTLNAKFQQSIVRYGELSNSEFIENVSRISHNTHSAKGNTRYSNGNSSNNSSIRNFGNSTCLNKSQKQSEIKLPTNSNVQESVNRSCYRCGSTAHLANTCGFKDKECFYCKRIGHTLKMCRRRNKNQNNINSCVTTKLVSGIEQILLPQESDIFNISELPPAPIIINIKLNGCDHKMEVDCGAAYSVMSLEDYYRLWPNINKRPLLNQCDLKLKAWSQNILLVKGVIDIFVYYKNANKGILSLIIVESGGRSLIGRNWFQPLGIKIEGINSVEKSVDWINKYSQLFSNNLGSADYPPVHVELNEEVNPIFCRPRPVPIPIRGKVENAIDQLIRDGVFEPTAYSDWASCVVPIVKRDGSIRICIDYKNTVNKQLRKNAYPLPTSAELMANLSSCCYFSHLDMAQAYTQLKVDDTSAGILTVNTIKGLMKVRRLPFGLASAPGLFQKFMDTLLAGIPGVAIYLDDVVIGGSTLEEMQNRLKLVLDKMQLAGLRLKKEKCEFDAAELEFLGFKISAEGIRPTEDKVLAIKNAPYPKNKTELQAFLGLINFYHAFLKDKATVAEPLHRLLENNRNWEFGKNEEVAFDKLKDLIQSNSLLCHYSVDKELILSSDASAYGIGSVLAHNEDSLERPIAFSSVTLSATQRRYSQLDKEALAIIHGVKKFHKYLAGRSFTIYTDHKPLVGIFNPQKAIPLMLSPRLIRYCIILSCYDYTIVYRPGSAQSSPDALSRLPLAVIDEDPIPAEVFMLESVEMPIKLSDIVQETKRDPLLTNVYKWLLCGFPTEKQDIKFAPYLSRREELSLIKDCVCWGNRVIVPETLRPIMLKELHATHPGISAMKAISRSYCWWPNLDRDIEYTVNVCGICQESRHDPGRVEPSEWYRQWNNYGNKWSRIHIDLMGPFQGRMFLLVIDSYSRWLEIEILTSTSSSAIISKLRKIFATHGLPEIIVSDNGSYFVSKEFEEFSTKNGIMHITTAPYHPASNGQVERYVQTAKNALKRSAPGDLNTRVSRFLYAQHFTINFGTGKSPAELLFGRKLRTVLDLTVKESVNPRVQQNRIFRVGDCVYFKNFTLSEIKWLPGIVKNILGQVNYEILAPDGVTHHRHIDHLRKRIVQLPRDIISEKYSNRTVNTTLQVPFINEENELNNPVPFAEQISLNMPVVPQRNDVDVILDNDNPVAPVIIDNENQDEQLIQYENPAAPVIINNENQDEQPIQYENPTAPVVNVKSRPFRKRCLPKKFQDFIL